MIGLPSFAQSPIIKVQFQIEEKEVDLGNNFQVSFITSQDTIKAIVKEDGFVIPADLVHKKVNIIFNVQKYRLDFNAITLTWNPDLPQWNIGIDTKPFNEEEFYWLKK